MTHELRGTEAGLVGYWKFNDGQGTTALDSAPTPHNGTLVGPSGRRRRRRSAPGPVPLSAYGSSPAGGAVDVPRDVVLSWKPGGYADTHDVYFGTVFADVDTASRTDPKGVLASQARTRTPTIRRRPRIRQDLLLARRRGQCPAEQHDHQGQRLELHRRALWLPGQARDGHGLQLRRPAWARRRRSTAPA